MQCAFPIFSSVACPDRQYFYTVSHNGIIFVGGGGELNIKCVFIFSTTSV
jgi:hypothetical protein